MTRHRFLFALPFAFALLTGACGGAVSPDTSGPAAQGTAQSGPTETAPPATSTSDEPAVRAETEPLDPQVDGTSAVVHFHRGSANLIVDRLKGVLALAEHTPGSDAFFSACGTFTPTFDAGTRVDLPTGMLPTSAGGSIAVEEVVVKTFSVTRLVLHVTMRNGTEYDDTRTSSFSATSDAMGVPDLAACRP